MAEKNIWLEGASLKKVWEPLAYCLSGCLVELSQSDHVTGNDRIFCWSVLAWKHGF